MATFRELIDLIALDLSTSNNNVLETEIKDAINRAHDSYQTYRFEFNEDKTTFDTVTDQDEYPRATFWPRVVEIDEVQYEQADHLYRLVQETYRWYTEALVNQAAQTGPSNRYVIYAEIMHLYPQPNEVTTVTVSGVHKLITDGSSSTEFTNDSDTNAFLEGDALQMMRARAKADIYSNRLRNFDMAITAQQTADEYFDKLKLDANKLQMLEKTRPFRQF